MPLTPPITNLPITTERSGFYTGFNRFVAFGSKVLIGLLILWAAVFPEQAGDASQKHASHIIVWGSALNLVIGVLLIADGLGAINTAMIIGALPFSLVMALMGVSLVKAVVRDAIREKEGDRG